MAMLTFSDLSCAGHVSMKRVNGSQFRCVHRPLRPFQRTYRRSIVVSAVAAVVFVSGCAKHGVPAPTGGSEVPPSQVKLTRQVIVAPVETRDLTYSANTVGTLEPDRQSSIAAGVAGVVDVVQFREGDKWTESDLEEEEDLDHPRKFLVLIDHKKYQAARRLAEANENRATENLNRTEAKLTLVRDQLERAARLKDRQAISQEEVTRWTQEQKVAEAEFGAAKADLAAAQAARELAQRDLARSVVRPPYKGQINQRRVAEGDFVKDETVIATIADVENIRLITWIPEMAIAGVHKGDSIQFELQALPQRQFSAEIFYISTVADPTTHMFECKATVARDVVDSNPEMKPGQFARVRLETERHHGACVIPEESVRASERGFVVFVPEKKYKPDGEVQWVASARRLQLGFRRPGFVEVLAGVEPGERVVTRGSEALEEGTPIDFPDEQKPEATAETELKKNGKT